MIQRIQSIWLLLAAAAAFFTLKLSFFSGNFIGTDKVKAFRWLTGSGNFFIMVLTVILGLTAFVTLFLFKKRKLQLQLTLGALLLSVLNILLYYRETLRFVPGEGSYNITALVSLLIPFFLVLAARGIRKDQKLVKSLDRLR